MGKLLVLFFHSIAGLDMAEYDCASLIFTFLIGVPSFICVDPKYMNWSTASLFHSSICWRMVPAWYFDKNFAFVEADFQQLFSLVFQWVVGVFLHCLPSDRCRQQSTSCQAVVLRWTLTTVGCQFLLLLLLHHLRSSRSPMYAKVSKPCAFIFSRNTGSTLEIMIMDIITILPLLFERNLRHLHSVTLHVPFVVQRTTLYDIYELAVDSCHIPDNIERFLVVDEIMKEFLLMSQTLFHQQP